MRIQTCLIVSAGLLMMRTNVTLGMVLGSLSLEAHGGIALVYTGLDVEFSVGNSPLLFDMDIEPNDAGQAFVATAANNPNFNQVCNWLTNGTDDPFRIASWTIPGGAGTSTYPPESLVFADTTLNGIDLEGSVIESITFSIEEFTLDSPGSNPNGNGIWTDHNYYLTVTVEGVPEPASLAILALGGLALLPRRRQP